MLLFVLPPTPVTADEVNEALLIQFNVPEQRVDLALTQFAEQAGITLLFPSDAVGDVMANRLVGEYSVSEGAEILLAGTKLIPTFRNMLVLNIVLDPDSNKGETVVKKPKSILARIGTVLAVALIGSNSIAQESGETGAQNEGVIEEVVVTAQRRSQNLQEVPISITALTSEDMDTYRFRDPADLAAQVANMQFSQVQGDGAPNFSLRGVSMLDWSFNQAGPVAVYVDEVYKSNPSLLAVPLFDMERVEVLRGPQGTLYGKNTTGGAVNFITKTPVTENEGYLTVGAGNYNLFEADAALNVALSDSFAVRVAGTWSEADGWFENVNPGLDDANSIDEYGVRLSVLWQPSDSLEVLLRATTAQSDPVNWGIKSLDETQPTWFGIYSLFNSFGGTPLGDPSQAGLDYFEQASEEDTRRLLETDTIALTVNWDLNDNYVLTSITAIDEGEAFNPDDSDGVINAAGGARYHVEADQFTQDLRLTSNLDGPFNFVAGLYYSNEELDTSNSSRLFLDLDTNLDGALDFNDCLDPLAVAFGFPPSAAGAATDALFGSLGFSLGDFAVFACDTRNSFEQEKESWAAYFDGSYALSDALTLRFGLRYTDDEGELSNFNSHFAGSDGVVVLGAINGGSADPLATDPQVSQSFSDTEVTGKVGLDYTLSNGTLIYGSFSQGYRGGAFNAQAFYDPREVNTVDPEYLDSFEVGFKSTLWDDRVRLNGAAFYYSYENQQIINGAEPPDFIQTLISVDESEIVGLEIEASAQVTPALLLSAGIGILDAEVEKGTLQSQDLAGEAIPLAADFSMNVAADWDLFTNESGALTLHVDANYLDEVAYGFFQGQADDYVVINARLSFLSRDEQWGVSLWAKNLTEEEYATFFTEQQSALGTNLAQIGAPRTYGAELSYRF